MVYTDADGNFLNFNEHPHSHPSEPDKLKAFDATYVPPERSERSSTADGGKIPHPKAKHVGIYLIIIKYLLNILLDIL